MKNKKDMKENIKGGGGIYNLNVIKWNFKELYLKDGIKCRIRILSRVGIFFFRIFF